MLAVVVCACGSAADHQIDVAGYPRCIAGAGRDLGTSAAPELTVAVDLEQTRQTVLGFGASDCWSIQYVGLWPSAKREAIADLLFETGLDETNDPRGVGLTIWRFNIGAGSVRRDHVSRTWRRADCFLNDDFTAYDWGRQPGQRWFLQAAAARGVPRFIAFVNSPPINMTKNGRAFCDSSSGTTNLGAGREEDFAAYLAEVVRHFREVEGIDFNVVSPFNEPQWDWEAGTQEGCRYSTADMKAVIDLLAADPGLGATEIEIPESGSILDLVEGVGYIEAFFDSNSPTFCGDLVAPRISGHSYKTDLPSTGIVAHRLKLRTVLDRLPGLQYVMTEYCPLGDHGVSRDLGIDTALQVSRVIHFDLVAAGASSWQWWLAVSPYDYKDGLIFVDQDIEDGEFHESKLLWAMGNFSRFVRPGMVRLDVRRSDDATHEETVEGIMVSSYLDRDREIVATVFINWTRRKAPVQLVVEGSLSEGWIPYVTSDESDLRACELLESGETILLPARSIVTLVGQARSQPDRNAV